MKNKSPKRYVSRSVYQKVCEENRRLMGDIRILSMRSNSPNAIEIIDKWRHYFECKETKGLTIRELVDYYMKNNPEDPAVQFVKSLNKDLNVNTKTNP